MSGVNPLPLWLDHALLPPDIRAITGGEALRVGRLGIDVAFIVAYSASLRDRVRREG
jgi:hypothetical protein